jgi:hypothetical protein
VGDVPRGDGPERDEDGEQPSIGHPRQERAVLGAAEKLSQFVPRLRFVMG